MRQLLKKLIEDQAGMIISSEIVLVGTILVLGSMVGLASLSSAVTHELKDVAQACDQTYNNNSSNDSSRNDYYLTSSQGTPEIAGGGYYD